MGNMIVLFEVTVKDGKMENYQKMAAGLKDALFQADGFIRSERFSSLKDKGKLPNMSVRENKASVKRWRNLTAHRMCQKHGRMEDLAGYAITVVTPKRTYSMTRRQGAPVDSTRFLEV